MYFNAHYFLYLLPSTTEGWRFSYWLSVNEQGDYDIMDKLGGKLIGL